MERLSGFSARHAAQQQAGSEGETCTRDLVRAMRERPVDGARLAAAAMPLHERIVQPMVNELTGRFPNAFSAHHRVPGGLVSECRFTCTPRYPASATVSVALEWDAAIGNVWLRYAAEVQPHLVPLERGDRHDIGLTPPGTAEDCHWIEAKLQAFVAVYLEAVEYRRKYHGVIWRTDPVCGMREAFGTAGQRYAWNGQSYWLCSAACRGGLAANPELFLTGQVDLGSGRNR